MRIENIETIRCWDVKFEEFDVEYRLERGQLLSIMTEKEVINAELSSMDDMFMYLFKEDEMISIEINDIISLQL